MNKKRIAAVTAAAAMLLNTMPVMAADIVSPSATATGSATVSGSGTVNAYNKGPIFKVTLPTANALDFTVDPYGLLDIASGGSTSIDDLTNTGAIVSASGSAAVIKNESSVPVTVTVGLTGVATASGSATVNFKNIGSEVATGSGTNMFLAIIPSATMAATATEYQPAGYAIPATTSSSGADAKFRLNKAEYEVKENNGSFTMQIVSGAANYDATTFKVGGLANPEADWSDFMTGGNSTVKLNAVFTYAEAVDADVLDESLGVYGLVSGSAANITNDMGSVGGSGVVSGTGLSASSESGVDFEVTDFSVSSAYTLTINDERAISAVKSGNNLTMTGTLNANISNANHTVTIPANSFGSGAVNAARYIKLKSTSGDIVIKLNCVA